MTILSPFLSLNGSCDQALQITRDKLSPAGLWTIQTFNLNTARLGLHECTCPNHGTESCDCQLIVLMVYGDGIGPATIILHGNGGKTWVSVIEDPQQRTDTSLIARIRQALLSEVSADL
jgi:hypothetical protein